MADGRFVSKSIAQSEQLGRVSLEADYLFGRCIPHLDREGRMTGNPELVRSMVCPLRRELDEARIGDLLAELVRAGLVAWYELEGRQSLSFPGFHRHQRGLRKGREAASRLPGPNDKGVNQIPVDRRTGSGPTPEDSGLTPPKGSELKGSRSRSEVKVPAAPTANQPANWVTPLCEAWQQRFGGTAPGGRIGKVFRPLREKYSDDEILRRWQLYLTQPAGKWVNPEDFAQKFSEWDGSKAVPGTESRDDRDPRPGESGDDIFRRLTGGRA